MVKKHFLNRIHHIISEHPRFEIDDFEIFLDVQDSVGHSQIVKYLNRYQERTPEFPLYIIDELKTIYSREFPSGTKHAFGILLLQYRGQSNCLLYGYLLNGPRFHGKYSPGEYFEVYRISTDSLNRFFDEFKQWLSYIWREISYTPAARITLENEASIAKLLEQIETLPDKPFVQEEIDKIKQGFDRLEQEMRERFKTQSSDQTRMQEKIDMLHMDIDTLKTTVETLTQPKWARMLAVRWAKWMNDPDAKKLLPDGGGDVVSGLLGDGGE